MLTFDAGGVDVVHGGWLIMFWFALAAWLVTTAGLVRSALGRLRAVSRPVAT